MMPLKLEAGDVLSYSSGTSQEGPYGFRRLREGRRIFEMCAARWPQLIEAMRGEVPLIINAYPASLGRFEFGISVDTYLNPNTTARAFQLAALEDRTAILIAQPLFAAELIERYARGHRPFPKELVLATGGYFMPASLEAFIRLRCLGSGCRVTFIHFYGVAEVDAACLAAMERDESGDLLYHEISKEIEANVVGGELLLSVRATTGEMLHDRYPTSDPAEFRLGAIRLLPKSPDTEARLANLEDWSFDDWQRRTGRIGGGDSVVVQLREGLDPTSTVEMEFHSFARLTGANWFAKPEW